MTAFIKEVSEILKNFIERREIESRFPLEMQGVVHIYTSIVDGSMREYYSCSFKCHHGVDLYQLNSFYKLFDSPTLLQQGLKIENVSYLEFDQTAVGPGKRYQAQFSFRR